MTAISAIALTTATVVPIEKEMNAEPLVKLIKKAERETPEVHAETGFFVDPNRWSAAVRSWVSEFQQDRRGESLPAFVCSRMHSVVGGARLSLPRAMENVDC